jgi:hypothetical protein
MRMGIGQGMRIRQEKDKSIRKQGIEDGTVQEMRSGIEIG